MGFGLLLIGYFIVTFMSFNPIGTMIRLLGYGMILLALKKLRLYHGFFLFALWGCLLMILVSVCSVGIELNTLLYESMLVHRNFAEIPWIQSALSYAEQVASFVFHALLLWSIHLIARDTELKKISDSAIRNLIFFCAYEFVSLISLLPFSNIRACAKELALISIFLLIMCWFLNLLVFWRCYANIGDEETEGMDIPEKTGAFRRIIGELNRREQEALDRPSINGSKKNPKKGKEKL